MSRSIDPSPVASGRFRRALRMAVLVPLARLRFLFILGAIGLLIVKWDELVARYEKYVRHSEAAEAVDPDHEYFCPMHPNIVRDTNREKCPICFMPLSKRKKGEATADSLPAGTVSRVQLTPYRVVLAGVRTVPVAYQSLAKDITTVGTVEFDERQLKTVSAWVKGRIDRLLVNQTGQMVHRNDPLAELYSPDLVVTVQNLLDARATKNSLLEANARDRLRLWGIDDRQVAAIVASGRPITHLTIRSPIDGHVLRKSVREGQYVEEGATLFDVVDLSTVWVQAQLYEDDLPFLPHGGHDPKSGKPDFNLPITATARAFPGKAFQGMLSFLFPHVDTETRTLTVRFELPNEDHELRPGMTATVTLQLTPNLLSGTPAGTGLRVQDGKILAVPETAVIDTGSQQVVYRESLPNTFEGVPVRLGVKMRAADGAVFYPVLSGVNEGDRVVASGSFLLDAETRLNPAMGSIYIGGSSGGRNGPVAVRPTTPEDPDAKVHAALAKLPPEDRKLAEAQVWCPVLHNRLGSMEVPIKLTVLGRTLFVCCPSCRTKAEEDPAGAFTTVEQLKQKRPAPKAQKASTPAVQVSAEDLAEVQTNLAKLPPEDRKLAEAQRLCPVLGKPLGIMGVPPKTTINGQPVFVCCKGCIARAKGDPDGVLKTVSESKKLPPIAAGGKP